MRKAQIYISASSADINSVKDLMKHLKRRTDCEFVEITHRGTIEPGQESSAQIEKRITSADVIVIFLSADYLAVDDYIQERDKALNRHANGASQIIHILLKSVDIDGLDFPSGGPFPTKGKPIKERRDPDAAWAEAASEIIRLCKRASVAAQQMEQQEEYERFFNSIRNDNILYISENLLDDILKERDMYERFNLTKKHDNKRKLELLIRKLKKDGLLRTVRPATLENQETNKTQEFILERTRARKVILPKHRLKCVDSLREFALWVSDPPHRDLAENDEKNYKFNGSFLYMLQVFWNREKYDTVFSGYSALQMILNLAHPKIPHKPGIWEPYGRGNYKHPIEKLEDLMPVVMDEREIITLYKVRCMNNEQRFTLNGRKYRGCDLWGYPVFVAAA